MVGVDCGRGLRAPSVDRQHTIQLFFLLADPFSCKHAHSEAVVVGGVDPAPPFALEVPRFVIEPQQ